MEYLLRSSVQDRFNLSQKKNRKKSLNRNAASAVRQNTPLTMWKKEVSVKVYTRDYPDAKSSFMTSEKDAARHNNVRKEPVMTSEKDVEYQDNDRKTTGKRQENVMITSGKHQENIRKELTTTQDLMLLAMRRDPDITTGDLSELVRISTRNVARNIKKLQELGLLEQVCGRKDGKWIVLN